MSEKVLSLPAVRQVAVNDKAGRGPRITLARQLVQRLLTRLAHGRLIIHEAGTSSTFGAGTLDIHLYIHDARAWPAFAFGGSVGAGESFMDGAWSCDDLTGLVQLLLRNREVLDRLDSGLTQMVMPLRRIQHWLRRNSHAGSRRNIAAHYDLGNDFYQLWLDSTLMYSCALYEHEHMTLHQASIAKLDRICRTLNLGPDDHVLEIGTGWGGFAHYAAGHYGCRVTSITLSREQHDLAIRRIRSAGLEDRVDIQLRDYRDMEGRFDKLVSIEMIEAVGANNLDTYFRQCGRLLKPDGAMLLQAITIADQRYNQALREVDFIQQHIFPGGFLPSIQAMSTTMTRSSDLRIVQLDDIGPHYATTLAAWRERFMERLDDVRALGFDERFIRMWLFYLCYSEGGFRERALGTVQMLLTRPGWRQVALVKPQLGHGISATM